jgi:hypothetical protein
MIETIFLFLVVLTLILVIFYLYPRIFGATFQVTPNSVVKDMVKMAKGKKKVIELGSGDSRILIALAKEKIHSVGFEINPILVLYSKIKIHLTNSKKFTEVYCKSFWEEDFSKYDCVMLSQTGSIMKRLEDKIRKEMKSGTIIISYFWKFPSLKVVEKKGNICKYRL